MSNYFDFHDVYLSLGSFGRHLPKMTWYQRFIALFFVTALLFLSGCATTGTKSSESCSQADKEFKKIQEKAERGDVEAQYEMGIWYQYQHFCGKRNDTLAAKWYERAAQQGHRQAKHQLANQYFYSRGVPKDMEKAKKWYREAALQGHPMSSRMLGDIYFEDKNFTEAEKWYRQAVELGDVESRKRLNRTIEEINDPGGQKRKEREQLAREKEQIAREKALQERQKQLEIERLEKTRKSAHAAKERYGLVGILVAEKEESRRARVEARKMLEALPALPGQYESMTGNEMVGGSVYLAPYLGPYAPIAVLFLAIGVEVGQGIADWKSKKVSREDQEKFKNAALTLTESLAQANPEKDLSESLLSTADRQQATGLLAPDSSGKAATNELQVQIEQLLLFGTPEERNMGRLWVAVESRLISRKEPDTSVDKRTCYVSTSFDLLLTAEKPNVEIRKQLDSAYRSLSSQILSEELGLSPDPEAPSISWEATRLCESALTPIKIAGGKYIGEMKDWKRHGYGEMRYGGAEWVMIYRGPFVDGKEHGEGSCRFRNGSWGVCTFVKGRRI
ncbi:hypothetical protein ACFL1S_01250 [Pseudomonadota bacterium]